jgi:hypothetical protein
MAAQGPWLARRPSHTVPAYRRVRWMPAATHAPVRYGAVGNIAEPGAGGQDR